MPEKEFDSNQRRQLLRVQVSELQHLPAGRQVFKSMGSVLLPVERDEVLEELQERERAREQSPART